MGESGSYAAPPAALGGQVSQPRTLLTVVDGVSARTREDLRAGWVCRTRPRPPEVLVNLICQAMVGWQVVERGPRCVRAGGYGVGEVASQAQDALGFVLCLTRFDQVEACPYGAAGLLGVEVDPVRWRRW